MRILSRYSATKYKPLGYQLLCQKKCLVLNNVRTWCNKPLTSWKVLFYGTDDFSVESLKTIYQNKISGNPQLIQHLEVVTAPLKNTPLAVRQFAMQNDVPLHDWPYCPPKNKFDIGVVVSFGYLIPKDIIESFELGILNVHASLLPRWRGAAPIFHAILNGDIESGVTLMQIEADRFDVGKILTQRHYLMPYRVTSRSMKSDLAKLGSEMLINSFENLNQLILNAKVQDSSLATKAPKIKPDIAIIKWQEHTCKYIDRLYRALSDKMKLETTYLGRTVKVFDMLEPKDMSEINIGKEIKSLGDLRPGKVFFNKRRKVLLVLCKDGWVGFRSVSYKGKKQMSAGDFYNGFLSKVDHHQTYFA